MTRWRDLFFRRPQQILKNARRARAQLHLERLEDRMVPATLLGITDANVLVRFDSLNPGVFTSAVPVTGLSGGESILGIDFRPTTGELYGLGNANLYTIDPTTAVATLVAALTANPGDASDPFVGLNNTSLGVDFNPEADRLGLPSFRVVTFSNQNLRIDADTGEVTTDTTISPAAVSLTGAAYTNVDLDPTTGTTIFAYDHGFDDLMTSADPNGGAYTAVGDSGQVAASTALGFDIQTTGATNLGFLALAEAPGTTAQLFTVDLGTGAATPVGNIGPTPTLVRGLTVVPESTPPATIYGVTSTSNLVSFNAATPGVLLGDVPITGLVGGDQILGIDFRPTTGVLYGLGNTNLYTINPATGVATLVAALTAAPGDDNPFVGLTGDAYGIGFNPVPDLAGNPSFRVVGNTGENLRINVANGQVTTDSNISPAGALTSVAYTNNDVDPATGTTIFAYEFAGDDLMTSADPNGGAYTDVSAVPSGVTAFQWDFVGLDIHTGSGSVNTGFLTLNVAAASAEGRLYTIDLVTGSATLVGAIGATDTLLRSLAVAPVGSFNFSAPTYTVGESGPVAVITVNRVGGSEGLATVQFATANGSATAPADYADSDQVLIFAPGVTSQTVTIPLVDDIAFEGNETINLSLLNPTGGALLGPQSTAVLTITDNETGPSANAFAIDNATGNLVRFNSATPTVIVSNQTVTGLVGGDTIIGLDFRPLTGQLFALGSGGRLYTLDYTSSIATATVTQVGAGAFDPALSGGDFGFDFNPVVDRIRVVSNTEQNLRLHPDTGAVVDGDVGTPGVQTDTNLAYAAGDPNDGANPNVVGAAYTNNVNGATSTTLFGIDTGLDILVRQGGVNVPPGTPSPNGGQLFTIGSLNLPGDVTDVLGFDIREGSDLALASLVVGGVPGLYTIDLTTGAATLVGPVGAGLTLRGLAIAPQGFANTTLAGATATFNGGPARDTFILDQAGGLLRHNRFSAGDPGFNSDFDFDPNTAGDQTLSATDPAVTIIVNGGDGDDKFTITPQAGAEISVNGDAPGAAPGDFLNVILAGADGAILPPAGSTAGTFSFSNRADVNFTGIETVVLPARIYAVGAGRGSRVKVFNADGTRRFSFAAFSPIYRGGVRVATGDINDDGVDDIVVGAATRPLVKIFDGQTGTLVRRFRAFGAGFRGGVFVGSGDVNNDNRDDILVGKGAGFARVKVFSGLDNSILRNFFAYEPAFHGGVTVAAGDVNNDGFADIITGQGPGVRSNVKVFSGADNSLLRSFFAFGADFTGGVFVGAGDINGDNRADLIVGAGPGAAPRVEVFSGLDNSVLKNFLAYNAGFRGGVRVAGLDIDGDAGVDILTGAGTGGGPHVKAFDGATLAVLQSFFPFNPAFTGGVFVG